MRPAAELIGYLDDYFVPEIWRPAADLFGNKTIAEIDAILREIPLCNGLTNSRAFFTRAPSITQRDQHTIGIRLPRGPGSHRLETDVQLAGLLPDIGLTLDMSVEMAVGNDVPRPQPNIDVNLDWGNDLLTIVTGGISLLILKRALEEVAESIIPGIVTDELADEMQGLSSYRYSRQHDLAWHNPAQPAITGVFAPANFKGSTDPRAAGYCDILIVADGFIPDTTGNDVGHFLDFVEDVSRHFGGFSNRILEAPFSNFRTAIRVWQMPLLAQDPTDPLQRAAIVARTPSGNSLNFANLARIAEIGLEARDFFGRDPIIVFASRVLEADRTRVGFEPTDHVSVKSNGQGPYVLLDLPEHGAAGDAAQVLIHELGHTTLGGYLADEYPAEASTGGCAYPPGDKTYHGPEPLARNVTTQPQMGWNKWQPWSGQVASRLSSPQYHEGGYEFDRGIYRFQHDCRMRCSRHGDFCPVCVEELARGFLAQCHARTGQYYAHGMIDLHIEYLFPWTDGSRLLHLEAADKKHLEAFVPPGIHPVATGVKLTVVGSSVPQAWVIEWHVEEPFTAASDYTGNQVTLRFSHGTIVDLTVRYNPGSSILSSERPFPETRVRLSFDVARRITVADLTPPTDLTQSVRIGAALQPVVDQATGSLSLPQPLTLSAKLGEARGYNIDAGVDFRIEQVGGSFERSHSDPTPGDRGEQRDWLGNRMLPSGRFTWAARTTLMGILGPCVQARRSIEDICFEVLPVAFSDDPQPPAEPFGLELLETLTYPPMPVGLKASTWHPNDCPIRFQFETCRQGGQWSATDSVYTEWITRDRAEYETLAVTGMTCLDLLPRPGDTGDAYRWRVRAEDDQGRHTAWVEGRPFDVYLVDRRPRSMQELAEILDELSPQFLNPRGPLKIPRLFFAENWPEADRKADYSRLRELAEKDPSAGDFPDSEDERKTNGGVPR